MRKEKLCKIIVGVIAIGYIIYMWVKKDILSIYSTMPKEQAMPLVVTTIAVTLIKVAALAGVILLIRWIIARIKGK